MKGSHRYIRSSYCSKFVLSKNVSSYNSNSVTYHGVPLKNLSNSDIKTKLMRYIKYGLNKAGDILPDGFKIP